MNAGENAPYREGSLKAGAYIALGLLCVLLVGAVIYYKERMLFVDAPHMLFRIINENSLKIEERRHGSFITQLFPLMGARLHLGLKTIMLLYSVSFNVFFLAAGALITFKFRRYDLVILLGFYLTLFASDTYFWTNNEIHQGITWLFLAIASFFCLVHCKANMLITFAVFLSLFYLSIWTHPLVMLVALFLWFFYMLQKESWPLTPIPSLVYSVLLVILCYLKFHQSLHHGYDSGKVEIVTGFNLANLKSVFSSQQMHFFLKSCVSNYWPVVLIFIAGIVWQRKWLLSAYTIVSALGYLLLICITYPGQGDTRFYIESEYMPLAIICSAPFVYYVLPVLSRRWVILVLGIIFCVRLTYIYQSHSLFTHRVEVLSAINTKMKEKGLTKLVIKVANAELDKDLVMSWGAPVESILLSQINGELPQRTFIIMDSLQFSQFQTESRDTLLGCFQKWSIPRLDHRYFSIDTTTPYSVMGYTELMR